MKLSLLILLISFSSATFAKTVARVLEINGNAFSFYAKKSPSKLMYGDRIEDMTEIMVDDNSSVSIKDEYGRVFHFAGGTYAQVSLNRIDLKNGYIWISSRNTEAFGIVNSVNSIAKYTQGQFIYSFDNMTGKSQLLVLTGSVDFSNVVEANLSVKIPAGHFSFVDQKQDKGLPRGATRVGLASYKKIKSTFNGIRGLKSTSFDKALFGNSPLGGSRGIASVRGASKGKIIYVNTYSGTRLPASVETSNDSVPSVHDYYNSIKSPRSKSSDTSYKGKTLKVRMYGFDFAHQTNHKKNIKTPVVVVTKAAVVIKKTVKVESQRAPASVEKMQLIQEINARSVFEDSLNESVQSNKRHPAEVNQLIDELQSYNQDFQKDY